MSFSFLRALAGIGLLTLVSCQQVAPGLGGLTASGNNRPPVNPPPQAAVRPPLSETVTGEKVGNGPVRVALLVPVSATGAVGQVGKDLANSAKLAVRDFGSGTLQIVIKDTKGQAAEASIAATQARDEGASLILGPLFSANVSAASAITLPARLPMIAFSSDNARARSGVYLLSFAPEADIDRTLSYGLSLGANRVVAFLQDNAYGRVAETQLRRTYDASGAQVISVFRYGTNSGSISAVTSSAVSAMSGANAIYIPEGGLAPGQILNALQSAGVNLSDKQVMGSGLWESIDKGQAVLSGAIYTSADRRNFDNFARRYKATYGGTPTITAALAYDSVSLAAELIRRNRVDPFNAAAILSKAGFSGVTGLFRFEGSGKLQRGLAVNKIVNGAATTVSPSPTNFRGF